MKPRHKSGCEPRSRLLEAVPQQVDKDLNCPIKQIYNELPAFNYCWDWKQNVREADSALGGQVFLACRTFQHLDCGLCAQMLLQLCWSWGFTSILSPLLPEKARELQDGQHGNLGSGDSFWPLLHIMLLLLQLVVITLKMQKKRKKKMKEEMEEAGGRKFVLNAYYSPRLA